MGPQRLSAKHAARLLGARVLIAWEPHTSPQSPAGDMGSTAAAVVEGLGRAAELAC
jgi:hypothetical protein